MAFTRKISSAIFKLAGWKVGGVKPKERKFVWLAAPHTSNWDFPLGRLTSSILDIPLKVLMKKVPDMLMHLEKMFLNGLRL